MLHLGKKLRLPVSLSGRVRSATTPLTPSPMSAVRFLSTDSSKDTPAAAAVTPKSSLWERVLGKEGLYASESFTNRWAMVLPAVACHMCIGSPYAWSLIADVITREQGFVASTASDWTLMETALPLSLVFLFHGLSSTLAGKWQVANGPRKSMFLSSFAFAGSLLTGAAAIHFHSLPLLYLGYGVLGGIGMGLGYTPPVQTLMQWFPDKKGIASGIAIASFGSGALIFTPVMQSLMKKFSKLPEYLGPAEQFVTKVVDGRLLASVNDQWIEVVNAGAGELAKVPYTLSEGLYLAGSGDTGAAAALATVGAAYFGVIMASSLAIKNPHPKYVPESMKIQASAATNGTAQTTATPLAAVPQPDFSVEEVMRKPQFYLLGTTFFCLAAGGMGLFSVAKPMMSEVFSKVLPQIVTPEFAAKFVLMVSTGNLVGRMAWGALSDKIGRKNTFAIFTTACIPAYLSVPYLVDSVVTTGEALPLYMFCGATMVAVSGMGAAFAILPAYESELFGSKHVSAVHGRMLMFSSVAGAFGPYTLLKLRSISEMESIQNLMKLVDPQVFASTFGAPMEQAAELVASKTLTISKLLVLCPPGTLDPTPFLYNTTMYGLSGAMVVAAIAQGLVRPTMTAASKTTTINVTAKDEVVGDRQIKK